MSFLKFFESRLEIDLINMRNSETIEEVEFYYSKAFEHIAGIENVPNSRARKSLEKMKKELPKEKKRMIREIKKNKRKNKF